MLTLPGPTRSLDIESTSMEESFNRTPFAFTHRLHELDLLQFDSLRELAAKYGEHDRFVASGARSPGTAFYSVRHGTHSAREAIDDLDSGNHRVLMKRPEDYDPRFHELLDTVLAEILELRGGLRGERIVRLQSSILVSSAAQITPFHFDPEITFFFQIEGDKIYHAYSPASLDEVELERFYRRDVVNIGQVDLESRDVRYDHVFNLAAGKGFHQPENSPHWVETRASRSISYAVSFNTDRTRAVGRTRAFNHYMRSAGLRPAPPGTHPVADAIKAKTMDVAIPVRKFVGSTLRQVLKQPVR